MGLKNACILAIKIHAFFKGFSASERRDELLEALYAFKEAVQHRTNNVVVEVTRKTLYSLNLPHF